MERTDIPDRLIMCERSGVSDLIKFLAESDFYTAPCSTKYHLAKPGGLAEHTWNVMQCANELNMKYAVPTAPSIQEPGGLYPPDSVDLAAVGHDLCKINNYQEVHEDPTEPQMRYLKSLFLKAGIPVPQKLNKAYAGVLIDFMLNTYKKSTECVTLPPFQHNYVVKDTYPLGHGEKSLYVMQQFVKLTLDEALSIRWHMAAFDAGIHFPYPSGYAFKEAVKQSKLVSIIMLADIEASNLIEV